MQWKNLISTYPLPVLLNFHIVEVEHRKNRRGSEHEYLILTAVAYEDTRPFVHHIRIERRPSRKPASLRVQLGGGVDAMDTISLSSTPFNGLEESYSLYSQHFSLDAAPNAIDLAAMLSTIVSLAPRYYLYTSACYWFARMVFEGLSHNFGGKVIPRERPHYRGTFARLVPVVDEAGSFLLRQPRALRRWARFQAALIQRQTRKSKDSLLHELIDHVYHPHRKDLTLQFSRQSIYILENHSLEHA